MEVVHATTAVSAIARPLDGEECTRASENVVRHKEQHLVQIGGEGGAVIGAV